MESHARSFVLSNGGSGGQREVQIRQTAGGEGMGKSNNPVQSLFHAINPFFIFAIPIFQVRKLRCREVIHLGPSDSQPGYQDYSVGRMSLFNKWCQNNGIYTCKRIKLDPYLTPYTNINSKWIDDLNVRVQIIKLLEEKQGKSS